MHRYARLTLVLALVATLVTGMVTNATAAGSSPFDPAPDKGGKDHMYLNGHNIDGDFYFAYRSVPEPYRTMLIGLPISEPHDVQTPQGKRWAQYFERQRMEFNPALPEGHRIEFGLIGTERALGGGNSDGSTQNTACDQVTTDKNTPQPNQVWEVSGPTVVIFWSNSVNPNYGDHKLLIKDGETFKLVGGGTAIKFAKGCNDAAQARFDKETAPATTWAELNKLGLAK